MVGDARLLILLPLETRQVAPDNTVVLTLKLGNETYKTDNRSRQLFFSYIFLTNQLPLRNRSIQS